MRNQQPRGIIMIMSHNENSVMKFSSKIPTLKKKNAPCLIESNLKGVLGFYLQRSAIFTLRVSLRSPLMSQKKR